MTRRSGMHAPTAHQTRLSSEGRSPLGFRIPLVSLLEALAVAEHLNFRHAADALGISQSSVSERIGALERDLGIQLFERRHRGVNLTEAGRRFLDRVARGVDELDHAVKTAGALARGERGRLVVGLHSSASSGFLADLLGAFTRSHPRVELHAVEARFPDAFRHVRDGRFDIAFVAGRPKVESCHTRSLWSERVIVALPCRHSLAERTAITWNDLAGEIFLVRLGGSGSQIHDHIVRRLSGQGACPTIRRWNVGRDTLLAFVALGVGVTLTTEAATAAAFPNIVFRPVVDELDPVIFSAVWSPGNRSRLLRDLLDLAVQLNSSKPSR